MSNNTAKRPEFYISEITYGDGTQISINANDIIVFVGPNNSGKSQALKDIYTLYLSINEPHRVVKELKKRKDFTLENYSAFINENSTKELIGNGHTITYTTNYQQSYTNDQAQSFYEISIFHNATNINVHDVNFEVTWYGRSKDVPVLVTGLALTASNSKFANINISYTYNSRNENDTEGKANDVYDVSNSQNYEVNNVTITYKKK